MERKHTNAELKTALSMCFTKEGQGIVDLLMGNKDGDPETQAARDAARRRAGYTEKDLDTKTVTLRQHFDMRDKLELALCKLTARRKSTFLDLFDSRLTRGEVEGERDKATSSQGGTDRALTNAQKRITALEAQVAKLTQERDAAIRARDEMLKLYLDQQAERGK